MACIICTSNLDLSMSLPSPLKLSGPVSLSESLLQHQVFLVRTWSIPYWKGYCGEPGVIGISGFLFFLIFGY